MSYSVIEYHSYFYIKGEQGDPLPPTMGPYRYETEARRVAEEYNVLSQAKRGIEEYRVNNAG